MIKTDDTTNCLSVYAKLKGVKWDDLKKKEPAQAEFLHLRFKLIEAEYFKENDKSLDALMVYVNSLNSACLKDYPDQLEEIFDKAVLAALFSVSNERRTGLLASLYEDPSCSRSKCRSILDKLMKGGLMFVEDVQFILPKLRDWQKREDHDFVTPLEYAVFEHNLICLTRIYDTVSIKTLLSLLHMKEVKVYMLLERMIRNNKLQAEIDTVDGFVTFTQSKFRVSCRQIFGEGLQRSHQSVLQPSQELRGRQQRDSAENTGGKATSRQQVIVLCTISRRTGE